MSAETTIAHKTLSSNEMYEAALKCSRGGVARVLYTAWVLVGLASLILCAWAEPFSARVFEFLRSAGVSSWLISFVAVPLVMAGRAVLMVESFGYAYHRFFQHVGFFTRSAQFFRRNQRFHWIHHMIIYPIGRLYQRARAYIPAEHGSWSWVVPALGISLLFVLSHGLNVASVAFIAAFGVHAKLIVDATHSRFHELDHPWAHSRYFQWLEEIHLLHHWDQRKNFTIVNPLMDILFGTYMSPRKHRAELRAAIEDTDLNVSDIINWRYLLIEASPAEHAAFISAARSHRPSLNKIRLIAELLDDRVKAWPDDLEARELLNRSIALFTKCAGLWL